MDTPNLDKIVALTQVRPYRREAHGRVEEVRGYADRRLSGEQAYRHALEQSPSMSSAEKAALKFYQRPVGPFNQWLREGWKPEDEPHAEDAQAVRGIDKLIARAKPTEHDMVVYRGAPVREHDPAFVSTTTTAEHARFFARTATERGAEVQKIVIPKGTRLLGVPETGIAGEESREVLLPRNSRFRVTGRTEGPGGNRFVHMELVH